jgi:hypothetical protein
LIFAITPRTCRQEIGKTEDTIIIKLRPVPPPLMKGDPNHHRSDRTGGGYERRSATTTPTTRSSPARGSSSAHSYDHISIKINRLEGQLQYEVEQHRRAEAKLRVAEKKCNDLREEVKKMTHSSLLLHEELEQSKSEASENIRILRDETVKIEEELRSACNQ